MNKVIDTLAKEIARLEEELRVHREAMKLLKGHFEPAEDELDFDCWMSIRASSALKAAGISSITELEDFIVKGGNLQRLKNIGRKSISEIADYLKDCSKRQDELQPFYTYCGITSETCATQGQ